MAVSMLTVLPGSIQAIAVLLLLGYVVVVRKLRFRRRDEIAALFKNRPLSSMTTQESFDIMKKLQELEFPYSFRKAQKIALLKVGMTRWDAKIMLTRRPGRRYPNPDQGLRSDWPKYSS